MGGTIFEGVQGDLVDIQNMDMIKKGIKKTDRNLVASNVKIVENSADIVLNNVNRNILNVVAKTGVGTLTVAEQGLILVSAGAGYTLTLPTAVANTGLVYRFLKTDVNYNLITLDGNGAETFNYPNDGGAATLTYVRLNTYGAEITIVSDGANWQCINEKIGQVPKCRVYLSADQLNIPNATWTIVNFNAETYDIGANFDAVTNHVFTVPVDGLYNVEALIAWRNGIADSRTIIAIVKNTTSIAFKEEQINSYVNESMAISDRQKFVKNDTIRIQVYQATGAGTIDIYGSINYTFLNIRLLEKS